MKKKKKQHNFELDKFDRKQKKHAPSRQRSSKNRYSIYDNFEDDDLDHFPLSEDEFDD